MIARKGEPVTDQQLLQLGIFLLNPITVKGGNLIFFKLPHSCNLSFLHTCMGRGKGVKQSFPRSILNPMGCRQRRTAPGFLAVSCQISLLNKVHTWPSGVFFLRIVKIVFKRGYYKYLDYWAFKKLLLLFLIKGKVCCRNGHGNKKNFSEGWRKGTKLTRSPY